MQSRTMNPQHPQSSQLSTVNNKNGTALYEATQNTECPKS